jgi:putative restriction endonuclease
MSFNTLEYACKTWDILIEVAKNKDTITYGDLAKKLNIHHRPIRLILGLIQDYCMEESIVPLTILVVRKEGIPGTGFIAYDVNKFEDGKEKVYESNISSEHNPFCIKNTTEDELITKLLTQPNESKEVYTKIKSRGMKQVLFRKALLRAYNKKCAFLDITNEMTLEACHIIPWSESSDEQKMDIRNGILLNSFHHKLFDSGLITISQDFKIKVHKNLYKKKGISEIEQYLTIGLEGQKINLPTDRIQYPLYEFIKEHDKLVDF